LKITSSDPIVLIENDSFIFI